MLRITESESTAAAKQYFGKALTRGDYYTEGQEIAGAWHGKGAEQLRLSGEVKPEDFEALLENKQPDGTPLTARTVTNRRPGYDFTFDVPKSVSILYSLGGDERIPDAVTATVIETMADIEEEMHARVRKGGAFHERRTGSMVWVDFRHNTSRPAPLTTEDQRHLVRTNKWLGKYLDEQGRLRLPDPHLHVHAYAFNATLDPVEGIWKAGDFMRQKRDAQYFQAASHVRLAARLQKLGYQINPTENAFEVAGIDRPLIELFSRRTKEIEARAAAEGITDPDEKAQLGRKTRSGKFPSLKMPDLRRVWDSMLSTKERATIKRTVAAARAAKGARAVNDRGAAEESIAYALRTDLERQSELSERRLKATALAKGVGRVSVNSVADALEKNPAVVRAELAGEKRLTTKEILREEAELLRWVREGRGKMPPLDARAYRFTHPAFKITTPENQEQRAAVQGLFQSEDWIVALVGRAGTGKTTLLQEVQGGLVARGKGLVIAAPTTQARSVLREDGFHDADTVKGLLHNTRLHEKLRGSVLWIDEAGMAGNHDILALLRLAEEKGAAKVVLAGDHSQIRSVPRGDALRFLVQESGLQVFRLERIQRQKRAGLKAAVTAFSQGDAAKGIDLLDAQGAVIEEPKGFGKSLAKHYTEIVTSKRSDKRSILVVSATHKEGEAITDLIREELRAAKVLKREERSFHRTINMSWTEAQKTNPAMYEEGLVVQFKNNVPGFTRGERVRVAAVSARKGEVHVFTNRDAKSTKVLPLDRAEDFQIYRLSSVKISPGERLTVTENGFGLDRRYRLENGATVHVAGFTEEGNIRLDNGREIHRSFGHLKHGYVVTADAAQSKTVDVVLIAAGKDSLSITDQRRAYVAVSRARHEAKIYTTDKAALKKAAQRDSVRHTGTELVGRERAAEIVREITQRAALKTQKQVREFKQNRLRQRLGQHRQEPLRQVTRQTFQPRI